jgi:uncharacterized protein
MAEATSLIIELLKKYILELNRFSIQIDQAYLYGSYAKGNPGKWSDIDVALISGNFSGIDVLDAEKIARPTINIDYRISPITFKPEDFSTDNLFVKEILRNGIRIV